jgi:hypothetical protein
VNEENVMRSKLLNERGGERTFAVLLAAGDEVIRSLEVFVAENKIDGAELHAIGAFCNVDLGYFDWETKSYRKNRFEEQVEVGSLTGDVATGPDGKPAMHIHCVLGRRDGASLAGHLLRAVVRPTLEIILRDTPAHLHKRTDAESGLALILWRLPGPAAR